MAGVAFLCERIDRSAPPNAAAWAEVLAPGQVQYGQLPGQRELFVRGSLSKCTCCRQMKRTDERASHNHPCTSC